MMQVLEMYQSTLEVHPSLLQVYFNNNNLQRMCFKMVSSLTKTSYLIENKQKTDRKCILLNWNV